uniref:Reverse transcriptase domain-containing protein n=1 Tax=Tanacetum cinerariifolium TaxID=118510 RepID=A0A699IV80_TANCI|nr:reverse transcriptase domain-containing protein [Tanacetum cinerariifolium]
MAECLVLADLGTSINLMPLSVLNKLSLPDLSPTCMTLELADRLISRELTLRVGKEAITFNLDQISRYSANYNDMTATQIDVIDMACEEYSQKVLGFSDVIASGNPTPYYDPIVSTTSPTLTSFGESDFLLEEVDAFLALEDDPTSPEVDQSYVNTEGDILLLEAFLNDDPSLPPQNQGNYMPQVRKELKICKAKTDKSSVDEPFKVELKDLPPHLEYVFLKDDDKLPVIITKDLSVEEKAALITVLKSHKRAIAWKLSDIKGIDPEFCTPKILMEDDFEPVVQHQRRVNPKSTMSSRMSVPKKGGFTVVENEENELILTRLVMGWRVCIDYRKLNEATRKDHLPLPFMDQMLERLAGNDYYCFLGLFSNFHRSERSRKTTFTCPYGTFAYRCMPFGLYNAPGMFKRCMMAIFHDMIEKTMERCEDTNLFLNWEKSYFMVKEGIVLGHKISKEGIEVNKAKIDVIAKLPHPTTIKGIRSFLGHAGFYRRFIKDFSKIARPMTRLLEKDTSFFFSKKCVEAFQTLKKKLTEAPILIAPDWDLPFELMCDASDFAIGMYTARKPLTFSRLATMDPPGDIMAPTTLPRSDRGTHFCNDQFAKVMLKYSVTNRLTTAYHPQTSGQVVVSNRGSKRILEKTVGENRASWSDKLDDALWAFRTAYKTPIGCTPCKLVYEKACYLPIELEQKAYWALKHANFDLQTADRVFNIGDRVLLFNSRLKIFSSKLKTRWSGPFTISYVFPYGTVELSQPDGPNFKVNGYRLKHYFGEDIPTMVIPDL